MESESVIASDHLIYIGAVVVTLLLLALFIILAVLAVMAIIFTPLERYRYDNVIPKPTTP